MAGRSPKASPVGVAVFISLGILIFILATAGAIGGSYALTIHTLGVANANHADSDRKQIQAELSSAKGECQALEALENSGNGVVFNKPGPAETVLTRMLSGIHGVVVKSDCPAILAGKVPPDLKSGP